MTQYLPIDFDYFEGESLSKDIWQQKYAAPGEKRWEATALRVVNGVYAKDKNEDARNLAFQAMKKGYWMPGGRIIAGAGTSKRVTLMNCYVNSTLPDSMEGIADGFRNVMLTMQQGGGIGTDFTPLRPAGAWLERTQSPASGPLPFMDAQDAICDTIKSAGDRRGAMMGTIADFHPDLPAFIEAKRTKGRLTNFNVSVLVSDAFMAAVQEDEDWLLYHECMPLNRDEQLASFDFQDEVTGKKMYVYAVWRARELWALITRNTYEYSEPGVIFIDRVNDLNNLQYCETIRCTNPCGEQPLPPHGTCNLGAVNLALMVKNPFTDDATFDWELLHRTVAIGVRFLDNVIDVTNYPLPEQEQEEKSKRRIGLGMSGLASAMAQLGMRYGSNKSAAFAGEVAKAIAYHAYKASVELAQEKGAFPLYDAEAFWSNGFAANVFADPSFGAGIYKKPLRNGVLLTIAPTGTTSIAYGNIPSGLEPEFAYEYTRNVTQLDGSRKPFKTQSFTARLWNHIMGDEPFPRHFVTADQLAVYEHIAIQEACQNWVDASISKTINCPKDMTYEEFVKVYDMAYEAGLKGCTTYRPSDVRGSILVTETPVEEPKAMEQTVQPYLAKRPEFLDGMTAKLKWPGLMSPAYVTLTRTEDGSPFEVFLSSKDQRSNEWMTVTTLMMSWLLRMGVPLSTVAEELRKIQSIDGYIVGGKYRQSLVAFMGDMLMQMDMRFQNRSDGGILIDSTASPEPQGSSSTTGPVNAESQERCPQCRSSNIRIEEGCVKCIDCGYSKCG